MLEHVPFFKGFTADQIAFLERSATRRRIPRNATVFHKGDRGRSLFVMINGSAHAVRQRGSGRQVILNRFAPHDCFGEMSFLDGQPRCATVVTREACDLLVVPRKAFLKLLSTHPEIYRNIASMLLEKLRAATRQIEDLAINNVYNRLLRILNEYRGPDGRLTHPFTQQEIAEMVGASRETICRLINDLTACGYLSRDAGCLVVKKQLPPSAAQISSY